MYEEKIQKVSKLNKILDSKLNLQKLKQNHLKQIFYKIAMENLLRYKKNFAKNEKEIDVEKFDAYLKKVANYLEKLYFKNKLEEKDILELHKIIMDDLKLEKIQLIGLYRESKMTFHGKNLKGKVTEISLGGVKFVKKNFLEELDKLNTNISKSTLLTIVEFIMNSFIIHPFENGNGKTFWILLDLLLLKYDYFPIFVNRKEIVEKSFADVFSYYVTYKKKELLIPKFLDFMVYIYSNYKL